MSRYGELVESNYTPVLDEIYAAFSQHFQNPAMIKLKNESECSMYICKIHSLTKEEQRYVIAFTVKNEEKLGTRKKLSDLRWISLQTRIFPNDYDIPMHFYTPRRIDLLQAETTFVKRGERCYEYEVKGLPIKMILLSTKDKKTSSLEYSLKGTLTTALETFQTVLSLYEDKSFRGTQR